MLKKTLKKNSIASFFDGAENSPLDVPFNPAVEIPDAIALVKRYLVISDHAALTVVLWSIMSWCPSNFTRCPLLLINAPERECGKTQLLKVIEKLVYNPLETANITMASLFRLISEYSPTLLIDEADTFIRDKTEMVGLINAGFEKGGRVFRVETDKKGEHTTQGYEVYGPKVLAGIALERHLPDPTISRGIQIPMKRKTREDKVERLRGADPSEFAKLRRGFLRFVIDHRNQLSSINLDLPEKLSDRQQDCWEALLIIAHLLGREWYEKAIEAALTICTETDPPKSSSNQLLEDIRVVLAERQGAYIPSTDLLQELNENEDMDWKRYNHGQPLTPRQLAKLLGPYGIKPKTVRMDRNNTPKGYEVAQMHAVFDRYLAPEIDSTEDLPSGSQFSPVPVRDPEPGEKPAIKAWVVPKLN